MNEELRREMTERTRAEGENGTLKHSLAERMKELSALHGTARILQKEGAVNAAMLQELVALLPPAFQYPEITAVRIRLGPSEAVTPRFGESVSVLRSEFTTADGQAGSIEVGYTENRPPAAEGPFYREERALIDTLSDILRSDYNRRLADEKLRQSKSQLAEAQHLAHIGSWNWDLLSDIHVWSDELYRILGYQPQEFAPSFEKTVSFVHPEDRAEVREGVRRARATGEPIEHYFRVRPVTGGERIIYSRGEAIRDESGNPIRLHGTAQDVTELKQAEEQLKRSNEKLRALSAGMESAREEEGTRIAREIHDELGSALTSLRWDLQSLNHLVAESADRSQVLMLREKIESMMGLTDASIGTVRRIASELRPPVLDDLGLVDAIEWQTQQFQLRTGIACDCDCALEGIDVNREQATAVFRIFQEALTNILRHAQATAVHVSLEREFDELVLTIRDNGRGITADEQAKPKSLGVLGMRERAQLIGATLEIVGVPSDGTTVRLRTPLPGV